MEKKFEMEDPKSCLNKAADDEPIFVLRASDKLAPAVISLWAELATMHGCSIRKHDDALICATKMTFWGNQNGSKFPD